MPPRPHVRQGAIAGGLGVPLRGSTIDARSGTILHSKFESVGSEHSPRPAEQEEANGPGEDSILACRGCAELGPLLPSVRSLPCLQHMDSSNPCLPVSLCLSAGAWTRASSTMTTTHNKLLAGAQTPSLSRPPPFHPSLSGSGLSWNLGHIIGSPTARPCLRTHMFASRPPPLSGILGDAGPPYSTAFSLRDGT